MATLRVLVGNDPCAYREAIAAALQAARPRARVTVVEPDALDAEVLRGCPDLVVCSQITELVRSHALAWVLLYPAGEARAVTCLAGHETAVPAIEFDQLLALLDQADLLLQAR